MGKKILVTRHLGAEAMALITDQTDFEVRILLEPWLWGP